MKRAIALVVLVCVMLSSCANETTKSPFSETPDSIIDEVRACWVTYSELDFDDKSKSGFENGINSLFKTAKDNGLNTLFVHVISHFDAYYNSKILPMSKYVAGKRGGKLDYDPLSIMCQTARKYGLKIHAWINPFRIMMSTNIDSLDKSDPAVQLLKTADASVCDEGAYLVPSSEKAQNIMLSAIREVVENYDIDGVHFDDYFYPTTDEKFDKIQFSNYKGGLPLADYRRAAVDSFVSATYRIVKSKSKELKFGISPQANVKKNRDELYADVEKWCQTDGYIDYIMPQLYFGFEDPRTDFKFENILKTWQSIAQKCELQIGLGLYRAGEKIDSYGVKSDEWVKHSDIIARQIRVVRSAKLKGFAIFSCTSLIDKKTETENMRKEILS